MKKIKIEDSGSRIAKGQTPEDRLREIRSEKDWIYVGSQEWVKLKSEVNNEP